MEVSQEKGKEGEKDVEKVKAESTTCWINEQLRSVSSILRFWKYG